MDKKTSSLAQRIASLSEEQFESVRSGVTNQYPTPAKLGLEAYNHAAEVKVRAERKAGELLKQLERGKGGNPNLLQVVTSSPYSQLLEEQGINRPKKHYQTDNVFREVIQENNIPKLGIMNLKK